MKILIISDIHGNINNLNIIDNISFDKLICLGDIYSYGYTLEGQEKDKLVEEKLFKYIDKLICLRGNCDYQNKPLFLDNDLYDLFIDSHKFYFTHGDRYSYTKGNKVLNNSILIYGHEHVPYIKKENNNVYICIGSIGKPRYGSSASYAIYEDSVLTIYSIDGNMIDTIYFNEF